MGLMACALIVAQAQTTNVNQLEKKPEQGFFPTATYAFSDIETVSVTGGNLMLNIPIARLPPGRGGMQGPPVPCRTTRRPSRGPPRVCGTWTAADPCQRPPR